MFTTRLCQATRAVAAFTLTASSTVGLVHGACWDNGTTPRPDSQYVVQSADTVIDTVTNLMWKRCTEGLSGAGCATGSATFMGWDTGTSTASGSTFAGYNDWRMPSLTELQSLLPSACFDPKINSNVFPNTLTFNYWSAVPVTGSSSNAWAVFFGTGGLNFNVRDGAGYVRLVRAGQSFGILAPTLQTLAFGAPPTLPYGGSAVIAATSAAPNSGNPVIYAGTTPAVCTVAVSSGGMSLTVAAQVGDTCTISANQFGRANNGQNYAQAAQVTQSIVVNKAAQILSFATSPPVSVGGTGVVAATSNQNLTPVIFSSATPGVCTVSGTNGSTVTGIAVGACTITASQPGDATYLAASANQSFGIGPVYLVCNLHMDGANPMLATKEGLILLRAMLGFTGTAVTAGTGIVTPWDTIRDGLNSKCGTSFQ